MILNDYAEVLERAINSLVVGYGCCGDYPMAVWCNECAGDRRDADHLRILATALREAKPTKGRVVYAGDILPLDPDIYEITLPEVP